ncbi:hypothetical protein JCM11641_005367 [Rhodosporidiobolus odoratus]
MGLDKSWIRAVMALSLLAPLGYIAFLIISLSLFSKIYRKRQAKKPATEPWFPPHKSRDIYVSLLSLDPPPPRPILIAALLRRAMDDVRLIWSVRDAKTSLTTLLAKGQIGDELWEQFLAAEKELEAEIFEVVGEANTFEAGYGQKIFGVASDMVSHERWKEVYTNIGKKREEEKEKVASATPPAAILSPTPYLTPSSLTLSPSNPLPQAGTPPIPPTSLIPSSSAHAPLSQDATRSSPQPSRDSTPPPELATAKAPQPPSHSHTQIQSQIQKHVVPSAAPSPAATAFELVPPSAPGTPARSSPTSSAPGSPPALGATPGTTPKKTPTGNKKGKRKPAVKGGR